MPSQASRAITGQHTFKKYEETTCKNKYVYTCTFIHVCIYLYTYPSSIYIKIQISVSIFQYKKLITANGFLKQEFKRPVSNTNTCPLSLELSQLGFDLRFHIQKTFHPQVPLLPSPVFTVLPVLHHHTRPDHFLTTAAPSAGNLPLPCLVPSYSGQARTGWPASLSETRYAGPVLCTPVMHGECCMLSCVLQNSC